MKNEITEIKAYQTSDGKQFLDGEDASKHQHRLTIEKILANLDDMETNTSSRIKRIAHDTNYQELIASIWTMASITGYGLEIEKNRKNRAWVLTRGVNAHNQEGHYLHALFFHYPSKQELIDIGLNEKTAKHVHTTKGGRIQDEDEWYQLKDMKPGVVYEE